MTNFAPPTQLGLTEYHQALQSVFPGIDMLTLIRVEGMLDLKPQWVSSHEARFSPEMVQAVQDKIHQLCILKRLSKDERGCWRLEQED